jgi:predicted lipoprotein with Yx(FWY)xxD motif
MNRNLIIGGVTGLALATGIGVAIAAGTGGSGASSYGAGSSGRAGGAAASTVQSAKTGLGQILVDGRGRTLYLFKADQAGKSACENACASVWPPLTTSGTPTAGEGAVAGQLGTLQRADGSTQITYHGHPLYLYAGDSKPGATNGQGLDQFGAEWYVLTSTGNEVDDD